MLEIAAAVVMIMVLMVGCALAVMFVWRKYVEFRDYVSMTPEQRRNSRGVRIRY